MPTLRVDNFDIVCSVLGGFVLLFGLVSYLFKEKFYLSEALISLIAGIIFSPHATNFLRPAEYALGSEETLNTITLYFTRLVLGVQLVIAGVQLPSKYLKKEWKPLAILLGPGMAAMWISTSLIVWALVPNFSFLSALAVGACVTPTDPVLSNSIVKGKFADKNIPLPLQRIIIAESGANDGLGYPFLFLPLYLIKYIGENGAGQHGGASKAVGLWFGESWGYTILLSVVYGAVVGWLGKEALHWAEERKYVDRESFLVFSIALALFIVGTCGMIGSDDVLACFIAGNTFTWDDWFRQETMDDSLQPTVDMLLNVAIFIWFGAVCPWHLFASNDVIPIYRLVFIGLLVLLLRRIPFVLAVRKHIHQIEEFRQALFVGFFGPIGVSAIFYLYISLEFLPTVDVNGNERRDAKQLGEVMTVVIWFMAICSIIVHGLSIPLGKLGVFIPRTLSHALSEPDEPAPFHIRQHTAEGARALEHELGLDRNRNGGSKQHVVLPRPLYRIGRSVIRDRSNTTSRNQTPSGVAPALSEKSGNNSQDLSPNDSPKMPPLSSRSIRFPDGENVTPKQPSPTTGSPTSETVPEGSPVPSTPQTPFGQRSIRFPDEVHHVTANQERES